MRTTLTLAPDVADRLKQEVALGKRSFKDIVNDALRRGLALEEPKRRKPYRIKPHSSRLLPGIDPAKLHQRLDELAVEDFIDRHQPGQRP